MDFTFKRQLCTSYITLVLYLAITPISYEPLLVEYVLIIYNLQYLSTS